MLIFDTVSLYGLTYLLGAVLLFVINCRLKLSPVLNLYYTTFLCLGAIIGARLGYVLCYALPYYSEHPEEILQLYKGGMSFHGALAGLAAALLICCKGARLKLCDSCAYCALICLPLGRICNFLGGELYGRTTGSAIGMVFAAGGPELRYPSQLFEAAAEGPAIALIIWWLKSRGRAKAEGEPACIFVLSYALLRFFIEFTREPDPQLGLLALNLSLGQWLCLLQFAAAAIFYLYLRRRRAGAAKTQSAQTAPRTKSADG